MTTHVHFLALPAAHHLRKSYQTNQHTTLARLFNNAMHHDIRKTYKTPTSSQDRDQHPVV